MENKFENKPIIGINGKPFTDDDTARMFAMIHRRFGEDIVVTTVAIRRLLENSATESQVAEIVKRGNLLLGCPRTYPINWL